MRITTVILTSAAAIAVMSCGASAQQAQTGSITKVDAAAGGAAEDFKVQDGLLFNALQPGDKVVFTATEVGGIKTITKLEKQ